MSAEENHIGTEAGPGTSRTDADRSSRRTEPARTDAWVTAAKALLPKEAHPKVFRMLRPIHFTCLQVLAKAYSKLLLHAAEPYDCMGDHCDDGLSKESPVRRNTFPSALSRRALPGLPEFIVHCSGGLDTSIRLGASVGTPECHCAPRGIRALGGELRVGIPSNEPAVLRHAAWQTAPVAPTRGV